MYHSVEISSSFIWPVDWTLSDATTAGQSRPWINGNEGVLCIPQSSSITEASTLDSLESYCCWEESYSSTEMQSVFSTAPADWVKRDKFTQQGSDSYYHHHHHVVLVAQISLTLSRHFSPSFIASGRSSGQHPVSSHSCWMYVRAGCPAFARPCVGVH